MSERRDDAAMLLLAALLVLAVLGGGVFFIARRAASMRAMAAEQRAKAVEMDARVRAMTAQAEAEALRGATGPSGTVSVREMLDQAAAKLDDGSMNDKPGAAAALHAALGESYLSLNDLDAAEKHFNAALQLHLKVSGENDPAVAKDRENLARVANLKTK